MNLLQRLNCKHILLLALSVMFTLLVVRSLESAYTPPAAAPVPSARETKTILFWNSFFSARDYEFGFGSEPFKKHKCEVADCYTTNDKNFTAVEQFDAIIFHGPQYYPSDPRDFPASRSPSQRYIFFTLESPANRPVYSNMDGFYNWTMTYRLDSDILRGYFAFEDRQGNYIAPSKDPKWMDPNYDNISQYIHILKTKKKPVAWFVSNCHSKNRRGEKAADLQKYIPVDIYGKCGTLECPRTHFISSNECLDMMKRDYYFYLSYENSNCDDYLCEKSFNPLLHDTIPVVYSGADIKNLLPPGSYIDATQYTSEELSLKMKELIANPSEYIKYFWWKDYYTLRTLHTHMKCFCDLCKMLHDKTLKPKTYDKMNLWWHGTEAKPVCRIS